jgi:glycosyltransferase involved in cell wall biosynthesis
MKILLLSRYGQMGASSRVRFYQYLPYLEAEGIHVTVANLLENDYLQDLYLSRRRHIGAMIGAYIRRLGYLLKSNRFDLVWLEYEILPWLPSWAEMILSNLGIPFVVDYDDAVFHRYNMHPHALVRGLLGHKIDVVMRRAALVTVGNEYLRDYARKAGARNVDYIPSVIDLRRYALIPKSENPVFTIGWIGTPATQNYLHLIRQALVEVCKDGNAQLVLVGSSQTGLDGVPAENHIWSEETEVAEIQGFDVGIMPMPDDAWAKGKCGYKLIQYMACAKPVIASPVGVAKQMIEERKNGFLAATTADWVKAFRILREDHVLRERMGKAGRVKVEQCYNIQVTAPFLISLLKSIGEDFQKGP